MQNRDRNEVRKMAKHLVCKKCGKKLDIDWERMEGEYLEKGFGLLGKGLCRECLEKEILKKIKERNGQ